MSSGEDTDSDVDADDHVTPTEATIDSTFCGAASDYTIIQIEIAVPVLV